MGRVYLALDRRLQRRVAIKVLPQRYRGNSQAREQFLTEARASAAINHPNVMTIHDVGEFEDNPFLVMVAESPYWPI